MTKRQGLSGTALQWLAVLSMTVDHSGIVLVDHDAALYLACRAVGRIAFPLFAFLLAQGMMHTHSQKSMILRLAAFAFLSEIPFDLAFFKTIYFPEYQNVFFTLCLGAIAVAGVNDARLFVRIIAVTSAVVLAELLFTDYQALGVVTIVLFRLIADKGKAAMAIVVMLFTVSLGTLFPQQWGIYLFCLLSLPLLLSYNGTRGGPSRPLGAAVRKWGFYCYYPAHLLVLAGLAGQSFLNSK